jgi:uncharacterized membrane protein (DUF4010 family)
LVPNGAVRRSERLGFMIYPLLPNRFVESWHLLNPRQSWMIVIIVAGLGLANHVMSRIF